LFQGGINTPMIIAGPLLSRTGFDSTLISGTDLFATISQMCSLPIQSYFDSQSFFRNLSEEAEHRDFVISENTLSGKHFTAIRDRRYKLIRSSAGNKDFFDLEKDPFERQKLNLGNLTGEETNALQSLEAEADRVIGTN
jgi:arylsulfatase A-like enzyme